MSQDHIIYYWDSSYSSRCEKYKLCEGQIKWYQGMFVRVLAARVVFIEGKRAFKDKKHIPERKVFAAIAASGGQQVSGSCPAVVVGGGEVCGGRGKVCGKRGGGECGRGGGGCWEGEVWAGQVSRVGQSR